MAMQTQPTLSRVLFRLPAACGLNHIATSLILLEGMQAADMPALARATECPLVRQPAPKCTYGNASEAHGIALLTTVQVQGFMHAQLFTIPPAAEHQELHQFPGCRLQVLRQDYLTTNA